MAFSSRLEPSFWREEFPRATNDGVAPFLFKGLMHPDFDISTEIAQVVRRLQADRRAGTSTSNARARVYVDEDRRDDLVATLLEQDMPPERPLPDYMKSVASAERFGLVINNLEQASDRLAAYLGAFLESMFSVRGVPIGGSEQVAFAGNYSGTAFGVHEGYEHAFLCHFGPGVKYFYCLSRETYVGLTGGSREPTFGDYTHMLKHAEEFVMEPGDILYLPALVYHVGRQSEFSVSVAVPLYTYPLERYLKSAVLPALVSSLAFDKEGMSPLLIASEDTRQAMGGVFDLAGALFDRWGSTSVERLLCYHWLRLRSNGGWEVDQRFIADPALEAPELTEEGAALYDRATAFRLLEPYRLIVSDDLDCDVGEARLFLRGQTLRSRRGPGFETLVQTLNSYRPVEKPGDAADAALLRDLMRTGGLTPIERN